MKLLSTFNSKWEKVGACGRKWESFSYFCLYSRYYLIEFEKCSMVNMNVS